MSVMPDSPEWSAPPTALVVDDVAATRTGLAQLLRLRGYGVREAGNGAEGLQILREGSGIRVVVLDLLMPEADGYWFREQQLRDPAIAMIPVVVFTGSTTAADDRERLKVTDVLLKPISVDRLFEVVDRYCAA